MTTKVCSRCGLEQDISEFAVKRKAHALHCRACQKAISAAHYQRNKEAIIASAGIRKKESRFNLMKRRDEHIKNEVKICANCGVGDVKLFSMNAPDYSGVSVRDAIVNCLPESTLSEALAHSVFRCIACTGKATGSLRLHKSDVNALDASADVSIPETMSFEQLQPV